MNAAIKTIGLAAAAMLAMGNNYVVLGEGAARQCFEAAEGLAPTLDGVAVCSRALEDEALSPARRATTYANRGAVYLNRGDIARAVVDLDFALRSSDAPAEAYSNRGFAILRSGGDWREAKPLFDSALARTMSRPAAAHFGRAVAQELGGDIRAAYADYRRASQLEPGWEEPRRQLKRFSVRKA